MNVLAQIFGALALLILIISYQQTVRKRFLFLQIFSNIFFIAKFCFKCLYCSHYSVYYNYRIIYFFQAGHLLSLYYID